MYLYVMIFFMKGHVIVTYISLNDTGFNRLTYIYVHETEGHLRN